MGIGGGRGRALLVALAVATAVVVAPLPVRATGEPRAKWVAGWAIAQAQQDASALLTAPEGRTLRMFARTTVDGGQLRIRLANTNGGGPVSFGRVTVGVHAAGSGPAVESGTMREVRFGGKPSLTLGRGARAVSDPVNLAVAAGTDLAVSLFIASSSGALTGHYTAKRVAWLSAPGSGDLTTDEAGGAMHWPTTSSYWLAGVDVLTRPRPVVVAVGDSITDGHLAAPDLDQDWPAVLAKRLNGSAAVLNSGIGGNQVTRTGCTGCGPPIVDRFDHDVLDVPGVTHVVLFAGTNDIAANVPARRIVDTLRSISQRAHARGLKVIGGTITPRKDTMLGWNPVAHERARAEVNHWIRHTTDYDAVVDFDAALRDSIDPTQLDYRYDSGDRLHPNAAGLAALANAVDLRLVTR